MENETKIFQGKTSNGEAASWFQFVWKEKQGTVKRIEDISKYITSTMTVSITLFISFFKETLESCLNKSNFELLYIVWFFSIITSFISVIPWRYRFHSNSAKSIEYAYRKISYIKIIFLVISTIFYLWGMVILYLIIF